MCAALRLAGLVSAVGVAHRHPPLRRHGLRRHQALDVESADEIPEWILDRRTLV